MGTTSETKHNILKQNPITRNMPAGHRRSNRLAIKSERLMLRTFQKSHIPAIAKLSNNWDVVQHGTAGTIPHPDSEPYWETRLAKASEDYLMLVITTQQDGVIGYMSLRNPKDCTTHDRLSVVRLEVSFLLGQSFQNQGY